MNPKYHLLVAVAALSLSACTTDDTCTGPEIGGQKITFTIAEDSETRTTLDKDEKGVDILKWVSTDKVGIYTVGKNENPNTLTIVDVSKSPVEFSGTLAKTVSSGDMFYAYYPYEAAQSTDPKAVKFSIPAEQTQTVAGVYNGQSQPLVAVPMEFTSPQENKDCHLSNVHFRLLGAIVELQLYSSDEALRSEKIRSVTFESETPLAGDFSFNLTTVADEAELNISGYESKVATTSIEEPAVIPETKDEAARIYLTIAPGQYTGKIVVATDVAQYTFSLAKAMTFERAVIKGLAADLAGATQEVINLDAPIYFADSEVKQICAENWDTNGDGELSYKEAAAVTSIESKFRRKSISSFDELRYFTGVTAIGSNAFSGCSSLTSINLPDGVTEIGSNAFSGCSSLTNIDIPNGVTTIGSKAFYRCSSLTNIDIPNGVATIGSSAFYGCSSLTNIDIPDGVATIGSSAFYGCSSLTSINIPDGVTAIGDYAFYSCSSLTSINIPQTVTSIGNFAFTKCPSLSAFNGNYASADNRCLILNGVLLAFAPAGLTEYTIPDGVTAIGRNAFYGCSSLLSINIPDGVTAIEELAFEGCSSLTSINIPQTVTSIDEQSFVQCSSLSAFNGNYASADNRCLILNGVLLAFAPAGLTEYTIPAEVTAIGGYAFSGCSSLKSITIPDGVTAIGGNAFYNCSSLTSINIPDGVATIGSSAFQSCSSLTSINIPDGVATIGSSAFQSCSSLTSINIPAGVTTIERSTFQYCSNLTSISISDKVTKIDRYAFRDCSSLTSISIPDKVITIERYAFYRCSSLTSVYCKPTDPPTLGRDAFSNTPSSLQIYVPAASVEAYKTATNWSSYASQILADNN